MCTPVVRADVQLFHTLAVRIEIEHPESIRMGAENQPEVEFNEELKPAPTHPLTLSPS